MRVSEIAAAEGVDPSRIRDSIRRGLKQQDRIFNAVVAVQGVVRLIAIHPPFIGGFCTLSSTDCLQHIFCYFYEVICFINIGI